MIDDISGPKNIQALPSHGNLIRIKFIVVEKKEKFIGGQEMQIVIQSYKWATRYLYA